MLAAAGYRVVATSRLSHVVSTALQQSWGLVVIGEVGDVELVSTCQALAGRVPVLILSRARDCRKCQARAACGALSVPPPLEPGALLEAVDHAQAAGRLCWPRLKMGPLTLALDTDAVFVRDEPRPDVRDVLFRLLRYLVLRSELPVPFSELQRQVWKARVAHTTILSHVSRLRTALSCPDMRIVVVADTCAVHLEPHRGRPPDVPREPSRRERGKKPEVQTRILESK